MKDIIIIILIGIVCYFIGSNQRNDTLKKEKYEKSEEEINKFKKEQEKAEKIKESFENLMEYDYEQALKGGDR